jgi:hypothetical protein
MVPHGPVIPVQPGEPASEEEFKIEDDDVPEWDDLDRLQPAGVPVVSVGLAAEEQMERLQRCPPSPVSAILKRAMEQPPQPGNFRQWISDRRGSPNMDGSHPILPRTASTSAETIPGMGIAVTGGMQYYALEQ